jgi:hypothetical protein
MYVFISILGGLTFMTASLYAALPGIAYPLNTLSHVYGNSESISAGIADGSISGSEPALVMAEINKYRDDSDKSALENLQALYSSVEQATSYPASQK